MDFKYLVTATRARVYLLWAILVPAGFVATHYHQQHNINYLWIALSVIGLVYMWRVMPIRVVQMRNILLAWLVPIAIGIMVTGGAFYIHNATAGNFIGHLGAFWLLVMAVGYLLNGLFDPPSGWYWFNAALNVAAAVVCYEWQDAVNVQYLIAAVVSAWSMLNLWLFRSDV